ncbi:zeta toxin family protein [Rhodococcus sp. C3V]|uniref:zeta toxin family protein n=1 Tax=Rhodococcus sp. C3V TaxID=3034165 RepID=UPI0023E0E83B|nr:zeta toxin family protein [Rhodococcus sp. C3V]MDF3319870.1 zeta toxin family protein [Rhodococcus sp. C3V]
MIDVNTLRGKCAAELCALTVPGEALAGDSPRTTKRLYKGSRERRRFRTDIIDRYLADATPAREARSAVLTAGAPGAGKSTSLSEHVDEIEGYRRIDSDDIKDYLLEQALKDGIYDDLLGRQLADGHPISLRELATLVHRESTAMVSEIRGRCISRRENLVIEGTLTWADEGVRIVEQLSSAGYVNVHIIDVEVPFDVAVEQALSRWWGARVADRTKEGALGGRFVPPAVIELSYGDGHPLSTCATNARALFDSEDAAQFPDLSLTVIDRRGEESVSTFRRRLGGLLP